MLLFPSSSMRASANTPAETTGACVARFPVAGGLPRYNGGSASASCFSRPARRLLAFSPAWSLNRLTRPFDARVLQSISLPPRTALAATNRSDSCCAGFAPARRKRLSTAHDVTCFTKLHLLLLLRYLHSNLRVETIRICYTEPLAYATAFGRQLSYGVRRTVYLPYQLKEHRSSRVGLIAFLGHERLRLERIVQELEPELSVVVLGEPGFAKSMEDESRRVNDSLIHRASYDRQYRVASAPAGDLQAVCRVLKAELEVILAHDCETVYLAAMGTKIQALGFEMLRRAGFEIRMLLAYSIPRSYERNMYSQGNGPTYVAILSG